MRLNFVQRLKNQKSQTMPTHQSLSQQKFYPLSSNKHRKKILHQNQNIKNFKKQHYDLKQLLSILEQKNNPQQQLDIVKFNLTENKESQFLILKQETYSNKNNIKQNVKSFQIVKTEKVDKTNKKQLLYSWTKFLTTDQIIYQSPSKVNIKKITVNSQKINKQKVNQFSREIQKQKYFNSSFIVSSNCPNQKKIYQFPSKRSNINLPNFQCSKSNIKQQINMTQSLLIQANTQYVDIKKKQIKNLTQTKTPSRGKQQKRGLQNIGNTCYINSILQCLFHIPFFNEYIEKLSSSISPSSQVPKIKINQGSNNYNKGIIEKYRQIYLAIMKGYIIQVEGTKKQSQNPSISTCGLKLALSQKCCLFLDWQQQDAHQFMRKLLDSIHQQINKGNKSSPYKVLRTIKQNNKSISSLANQYYRYYMQRDDSFIYDTLGGQIYNKVKCINCKHESISFDNCLDLSLSMGYGKYKLQELLEDLFGEQKLADYYKCQKCAQTNKNSTKTTKLWKHPEILIIHLKRSQYGKKNQDLIKIPIDILSLKECLSQQNQKYINKDLIYSLKGIICHKGNIQSGHYWSLVREYGQWYEIDDQKVSKMAESGVKQKYQKVGSSEAYILFYCLMNK